MLMVISPAKTLDYTTPATTHQHTLPDFIPDAQRLIEILRELDPAQLAKLMKLSDKLAALNVARFTEWQPEFTPDNAKQAILAFKGDVYTGLDAETLSDAELEYAQQHLRILSGLYGLLRPLDLMQAYRLEMGTKLITPAGDNLYKFWDERITQALNAQLQATEQTILLNLASNEYFKSVKPKQLQATLVNVDFKDQKNGQYKIISFYAKKARGLMARYVIQNKVQTVAQLQQFDHDGYYFSPEQSRPHHLVFLRDHLDN